MTRPAARMCARCQRTTDEPVLVQEVHAATGPCFNVYACPDCATHYLPQPDVFELLEAAAHRRSRLTLYTIDTAWHRDHRQRQARDRGRCTRRAGAVRVGEPAVHVREVQGTAIAKRNPPPATAPDAAHERFRGRRRLGAIRTHHTPTRDRYVLKCARSQGSSLWRNPEPHR